MNSHIKLPSQTFSLGKYLHNSPIKKNVRNKKSQKAFRERKINKETKSFLKIKPLIWQISSCNKILGCYRWKLGRLEVISFTLHRNTKNMVTCSKRFPLFSMEKNSMKKMVKLARLTLLKTVYMKRERTGLIRLGDN